MTNASRSKRIPHGSSKLGSFHAFRPLQPKLGSFHAFRPTQPKLGSFQFVPHIRPIGSKLGSFRTFRPPHPELASFHTLPQAAQPTLRESNRPLALHPEIP